MRIIDADELTEWVWRKRVDSRERIAELVASMPTIEAELVKHGHWEHKVKRWANDTDIYVSNTCNLCKEESYGMYHYCPNCGAKMDERREDG